MTYLTIPDELDKRLEVLAAEAHLSKSEYALHALVEFVTDQFDYKICSERSERIEKGIDKPISLQEIVKKYGFENDFPKVDH